MSILTDQVHQVYDRWCVNGKDVSSLTILLGPRHKELNLRGEQHGFPALDGSCFDESEPLEIAGQLQYLEEEAA